jgi:hypothetical protein
MEELEDKIHEILYCHNTYLSTIQECRLVAKEVKDISIEFVKWLKAEEVDQYKHRYDSLFDIFIKEKYGTPETH